MKMEEMIGVVTVGFMLGICLCLIMVECVFKYKSPFGINELIKREVVQYNKTSGKLEWVEKDTVKITIDND